MKRARYQRTGHHLYFGPDPVFDPTKAVKQILALRLHGESGFDAFERLALRTLAIEHEYHQERIAEALGVDPRVVSHRLQFYRSDAPKARQRGRPKTNVVEFASADSARRTADLEEVLP